MRFFNINRGFTLVEVLVVVGIIGLLSSVVFFAVQDGKEKARMAERYSELSTIELALRVYKDLYGDYPDTGGEWWTVCTNGSDPTARGVSGPGGYIPDLAPDFIAILPEDPSGCISGDYGGYIYRSDGADYKFASDWTSDKGSKCVPGQEFADDNNTSPNGDDQYFCSVSSSGASGW